MLKLKLPVQACEVDLDVDCEGRLSGAPAVGTAQSRRPGVAQAMHTSTELSAGFGVMAFGPFQPHMGRVLKMPDEAEQPITKVGHIGRNLCD